MKIANTSTSLRIALTDKEFKLLGRPKRVYINLVDRTVSVAEGMEGVSLYNHPTDETHPHAAVALKADVLKSGLAKFGTETVETLPAKAGVMTFAKPTMTNRIIVKNFSKGKPASHSLVKLLDPPAKVEEASVTAPIDEAVKVINRTKAAMGKNFIISTDEEGYLEVMFRSGR